MLIRAECMLLITYQETPLYAVCNGAEVVFHMAAPDSSIDNYQLHQPVNVQGCLSPTYRHYNVIILLGFGICFSTFLSVYRYLDIFCLILYRDCEYN